MKYQPWKENHSTTFHHSNHCGEGKKNRKVITYKYLSQSVQMTD